MNCYRLYVFLALTLLCSCSIKEDRSVCPCVLDVSISEEQRCGAVLFLRGDNGHSIVLDLSSCGGNMTVDLPRGKYEMIAARSSSAQWKRKLMDLKNGLLPADSLFLARLGDPSDSIYAKKTMLDCNKDKAYTSFDTFKQYAGIFLVPDSLSREDNPIRISGEVDGLDCMSLLPHGGDFCCHMLPLSRGRIFKTEIPRQKDGSLKLELTDLKTGKTMIYDIGQEILKEGYDWSRNDLDDILVHLNSSGKILCEVGIREWNEGAEYVEKL